MTQQEFTTPIRNVLQMYQDATERVLADIRRAHAGDGFTIGMFERTFKHDNNAIREFVHSIEVETGWNILQQEAENVN